MTKRPDGCKWYIVLSSRYLLGTTGYICAQVIESIRSALALDVFHLYHVLFQVLSHLFS